MAIKSTLHYCIISLAGLLISLPFLSLSQTLSGRVINFSDKPLEGASVIWLGNHKGTVTNVSGNFTLKFSAKGKHILLISSSGFSSDTIVVADTNFLLVKLSQGTTLGAVIIKSSNNNSYISNDDIKTEVITSGELKKAACCDLAGCFETQSTVQPQTTNIITNSKELRILGLSGIYNQVLIDGFPLIQALTYTYGISSIPGPLVDNIFVAKGANSVLQGFESISGQINVMTKDPGEANKLFINAYVNSFSEKQFNAIYTIKNTKWSNLTAFNMVQPANRIDKDGDTFMDIPLLTRYMIMNRWKKGDENEIGWSTQCSVRYLQEQRIGGQASFDYKKDKGTTNAYGQAVNIQQPEVWLKTAFRLNDTHRFALYTSGFHQNQESYFGVTSYKANQTNEYANIQYEYSYGDNNVLKTGFSYRHLNLNEKLSFSENSLNRTYAGQYDKVENIAGLFAENTLNIAEDKLTLITGIRADHHNIYGWQVIPRTMVKYEATENLTLRASAGKGWRTVNIFSENIGMLASSRDIIFAESLKPEKAWNFGCNAVQKFRGENIEGSISLDFYHTRFSNQIFPDYDTDPSKAIIKNFSGASISNGFQVEASTTLYERISAKVGYVYLDVYQEKNGVKYVLPFNSQHRIIGSASYMPLSKKWHWDANVHWYGSQRLPDTKSNPSLYQRLDASLAYTIVSSQFTITLNKFEIYSGVENLFNFRQDKPIISWQDPFGKYFDTQFAWGPTRGIEMYFGCRFNIE